MKISKTEGCLHCVVLFARSNGLALQKKEKQRIPQKLFFLIIRGVNTTNVNWRTSANNDTSGVTSRMDPKKNSGSTRLENESSDRDSGERARYVDSSSSCSRSNVVVSPSGMV